MGSAAALQSDQAPGWRLELGVGLLALAVLFAEVTLTRIFSVTLWYHFAFFVISNVMLGFAAAGVALALSARWRRIAPGRLLAAGALGFAAALAAGYAFVVRAPALFDPGPQVGAVSVAQQLLWGSSLAGALVPAFFCVGLCLCAVLALYPARTARLYGATMLGSGLGAVAAVFALGPLSGSQAVLAGPLCAGVAGFLFSRLDPVPASRRRGILRRFGWAACLGGLGLLLIGADRVFPLITVPKATPGYEPLHLKRVWSSLACVDFVRDPWHGGLWGLSPAFRGKLPEQLGVFIDRWAFTSITRLDGDANPADLDFYDYLPSFLAYHLVSEPDVLVIGAGGGLDVLGALRFGARSVSAVEINPSIVRAMREDFREFSGGLYQHPRVDVVVAEGRHFLETTARRYDLIQLDGVDTLAATQAGAFALSENYLYTEEAFDGYLEHLAPDGILTLTRWLDRGQTLRLFATAEAALERAGAPDVARQLMLFGARPFSVLLARKRPFGAAEIEETARRAEAQGFDPLYVPGRPRYNDYHLYAAAADQPAFLRAHRYRVDPTTDDEPFFFEQSKLRQVLANPLARADFGGMQLLLLVLLEFAVFSSLFLLLPLALRGRRIGGEHPGWALLGFFSAIGLGFMLIEIALIQKLTLLLGHPAYALSVVLAALLVATGIGSLAAPSSGLSARGRALLACTVVAVLGAGAALWLGDVTGALLASGGAVRFGAALAVIAPLGLLMGVPFPAGLALVEVRGPRSLAWGWAANGCASVAGSALAMLVAMNVGFDAVFAFGSLSYLAAAVALLGARAASTRTSRAGSTSTRSAARNARDELDGPALGA